jgi:cytochrome c-type biogenesis protein CcmE
MPENRMSFGSYGQLIDRTRPQVGVLLSVLIAEIGCLVLVFVALRTRVLISRLSVIISELAAVSLIITTAVLFRDYLALRVPLLWNTSIGIYPTLASNMSIILIGVYPLIGRKRDQTAPSVPGYRWAKLLAFGVHVYAILAVIVAGLMIAFTIFPRSIQLLGVQELNSQMVGKEIRVYGAVLGNTIQYDPRSLTLTFVIVDIPKDASVEEIDAALKNDKAARIMVQYIGGPRPDLLEHGAVCFVSGKLGEDMVLYADELVLPAIFANFENR